MQIKLSLFWIIIIAGAVFILCPFFCDSSSSHDWSAMRTWLKDHHYTQAEAVNDPKPDHLPPEIKQGAETTVTGSGVWIPSETYTPADTIPVELSEVTLGDGTHWVKVTIAGDEVKWHRIQRYHVERERRWTGFVELANCSHPLGFGAGYRLFDIWTVDITPAVSVSTQLDWVAGEVQFSRQIVSSFGGGLGVGYRFHETDSGLHISGLISIEL